MSRGPLQVLVDARLVPGTKGGVESVVRGLVAGFNALNDADVALTVLATEGHTSWLGATGNVHVATTPLAGTGRIKQALTGHPAVEQSLAAAWALTRPPSRKRTEPVFAALGPDVVHFPLQRGGSSRLPTVYQPHDLQHRHLPGLFSASERIRRDRVYGRMCRTASMVVVGTSWVRDDVIAQFGVAPDRVTVVPLGAPAPSRSRVDAHSTAAPFAYYPAANWSHKNHSTLFAALALLRDCGSTVPLVLSGPRVPGGVDLIAETRRFDVTELVEDVGYVTADEVAGLTRKAALMVVPTLFESASFPIWEAMSVGTPVVCSDVTALPRQVGDAGVVVDARRAESLAAGVARVWSDQSLSRQLSAAGRARVSQFTWERTAAGFAAVYRLVARRPLSPSDRAVFDAPPLL